MSASVGVTSPLDLREWLEPDGLGGFAMGTAAGVRTRRYHALLLCASADGRGRFVLCNGLEAWVDTEAGRFALTTQVYAGDVLVGAPASQLESFTRQPWPTWQWRLPDGTVIVHEVFVLRGVPGAFASFRLIDPQDRRVTLQVRPLVSARDYHSLHHENASFRFDPGPVAAGSFRLRPYTAVPGLMVTSNGRYRHEPTWYRGFDYSAERSRGLDHREDLASPGVLTFDLSGTSPEAALAVARDDDDGTAPADPLAALTTARERERKRRAALGTPLDRAGDVYLIRSGETASVVAGYPWFTEWGRDTFISLRGLCLATGRLDDARAILLRWADTVSRGMLPNRIPDQDAPLEHNSVDASLWFVVAAHAYLTAARGVFMPPPDEREVLIEAIQEILTAYASGTRFGIRATADGLLAAGEPGTQLTWMDARVGGQAVTPRVGKPVEVQALWLNALFAAMDLRCPSAPRFKALLLRGEENFARRFWDAERGFLRDVVDVDHRDGAFDARLRPNQIFAVGGLPLVLLDDVRARRVVDQVEAHLLTPLGLRTLGPQEPGYVGRYGGDVPARDGSYHQGTVWPWLLGPFVEAWLRVRGNSMDARREARRRFLPAWQQQLEMDGLGGVSEIADGDPPHRLGGCPFQAWSVAELLRLDRLVLAGV